MIWELPRRKRQCTEGERTCDMKAVYLWFTLSRHQCELWYENSWASVIWVPIKTNWSLWSVKIMEEMLIFLEDFCLTIFLFLLGPHLQTQHILRFFNIDSVFLFACWHLCKNTYGTCVLTLSTMRKLWIFCPSEQVTSPTSLTAVGSSSLTSCAIMPDKDTQKMLFTVRI